MTPPNPAPVLFKLLDILRVKLVLLFRLDQYTVLELALSEYDTTLDIRVLVNDGL